MKVFLPKRDRNTSYFVAGLIFAALFFGAGIVLVSPVLMVAVAGAMLYVGFALIKPWFALFLCSIIVMLSPDVKIADVATLVTMAAISGRLIIGGHWKNMPKGVYVSFLIFSMALALGVMMGFIFNNGISYIYGDGRLFLYWFWLPIVYALASSSEDGSGALSQCVAAVAIALALVALLQYATGTQFAAVGRVGDLDVGSGQTRVQMQGYIFVSFGLAWGFMELAKFRVRMLLLLPILAILLGALYVNFGRGLWIWTALAVLLTIPLSGGRAAVRLLLIIILATIFAGGALFLAKPQVLESVVDRVASISSEGGNKTSYGWRKLENQSAIPKIIASPIWGVGVGGEYRGWVHEVAKFSEHTRYVHNSFLFIPLKIGIPGGVALLATLFQIYLIGWRARSCFVGVFPVAVLAVAPPLMMLSITQPELITPLSTMLFCFVFAGVLSLSVKRQEIGSTATESV